jgi:AraC-like DNA-binding protein
MDFSVIAPLVDFAAFALGSLFALLLWTARNGNHTANRWLAASAAALALLSMGDLLEDTRWAMLYPHLAHSTDWLILAVGPCVWLYVRRLTMNPSPRGWWAALNFAPAALCVLLLLPFYAMPAEEKRAIVMADLSSTSRNVDPLLALAVTHILSYWVASLVTLRGFARRLKEQYSSIEQRRFRWLAWVLAVTLAMWLFWLLGLALQSSWAAWLDVVAVPLGLYVLAFAGLRQSAVFSEAQSPPVTTVVEEPTSPRYARSGLASDRAAAMRAKLAELMEIDKPWLENDLTLAQLAARIGASSHHLSQLLNEDLGQTFFDFVNRRRVAEVQRCLADPAYASQTLLEVALAAGFNSKAAFNGAFKKYTGITPSQFRASSSPQKSAGGNI